MNVLDLFSGIGGFSLGLERAGMRTVAFCEIDPFCRQVLKKHWSDVPIYEDIRDLTADDITEPVDVICGGFPCQDISVAGRGEGIDGERSGLWQEYYRLIREIRPRFVVVENSSALTFRGLGRVLGDLAEGGYDAEWQCIPAAAVGAPHIRDRVWILAYPGRKLRDVRQGRMANGRCNVLPTGDDRDTTERREDRELIALVPGIDPGVPADWWRTQSRMDRSVNGLPNRAQRVATLGNAVVPQIPEMIGRAILQTASGEEAA